MRLWRWLTSIAWLMGSATCLAQDLSQKITLDAGATGAPQLLQTLSKQTGVPLTAAQNMANEILFVRVREMPLTVLMKRLAHLTGAKWEKADKGYRLVPDTRAQRQDVEGDRDRIAASLRKALRKSVEQGDAPVWDAAGAQLAMQQMRARHEALRRPGRSQRPMPPVWSPIAPAERALARLLVSMDLRDLAAIPPGRKATFATHPTRMQWPLGAAGVRAAETFAVEEGAVIQSLPKGDDWARRQAGYKLGRTAPDSYQQYVQEIRTPVRAVLSVLNSGHSAYIFGLVLLDAEGYFVVQAVTMFPLEPSSHAWPAAWKDRTLPVSPSSLVIAEKAQWKTIDPTTTSHEEVLRAMAREHAPAALPAPELDPARRDPLGYGMDDGLRGLAQAAGKDLIALLPDQSLGSALAVLREKKPTLGQFLEAIAPYVAFEDGETLVARPALPSWARRLRTDRASLSRLFVQGRAKGFASLRDAARYALSQSPESPESGLEGVWLRVNGWMAPPFYQAETALEQRWRDWLRLYGSLTPTQLQALTTTGLTASQLTAAQREELDRWIYHRATYNGIGQNGGDGARDPRGRPYTADTTIILPTGLPLDAQLTMEALGKPSAFLSHEGNPVINFDLNSVARTAHEAEKRGPDARQHGNRYFPGGDTTLTFRIRFTPRIAAMTRLHDLWIDASRGPFHWDQLPESHLKVIQGVLAALRQKAAGGTLSSSGLKRM